MPYTATTAIVHRHKTYDVGDDLPLSDFAIAGQTEVSVPMPGNTARTITLDAITADDGSTHLDALVVRGLATGP